MRARSSILFLATGCGSVPPVVEVHVEPDTIIVEAGDGCCCDDGDSGGGGTTTPPDRVCDDVAAPDAVSVDPLAECATEPEPAEIEFAPDVEWTWAPSAADRTYNQVLSAPIVGNLTDDNGDGVIDDNDTPDVAFTAFWSTRYDIEGALVILDGATGTEHLYATRFTASDGYFDYFTARGGVAAADVDGDGVPEVCTPTRRHRLVCVHPDGSIAIEGEAETTLADWVIEIGNPVIGDMDGDGLGEVAIANVVWNHDGSIRFEGGAHGQGTFINARGQRSAGSSVMADLDDDGTLELIAGNTAYREDGFILWEDTTADDGLSAVADFDLDGTPEVLTTGVGVGQIFDASGLLIESFDLSGCDVGGTCGAPTVADFDGDGRPEIAIAGFDEVVVYDNDTGAWTPLWSVETVDASGATGLSAFDFEDDGFMELVYADEESLMVLGGLDGSDRLGLAGFDPTDHASGTGAELPPLADVDSDGSTELILASNTVLDSTGWHGVRSIGSGSGDAWAPTRPVWNQYAYHVSNINDDLSLPSAATPHWEAANTFRAAAELGIPSPAGDALPDLEVLEYSELCVDCDNGEALLYVMIGNQGLADSPVSEVALIAGGVELGRGDVPRIAPGASAVVGPFTLDVAAWTGPLSAVVDPDRTVEECDEDNNDSADMGITWLHHCD